MNHICVRDVQKIVDQFYLGPINFQTEAGTVTAIVGENGAGKSTLIKLLMNLWKTESGSIEFFGENIVDGDKWKENVAYQGQKTVGFDIYNLKEMYQFIKLWYPKFDDKLFHEMVKQFKLPMNKPFEKLSEGMQQKMVLALTIPRNTDVMILDEPTSFVDIPTKKYIIDLLVNWLDQGERSLIIASHEADDIRKLADYLLIIKDGKQVDFVEKESLLERYTKIVYQHPVEEKLVGEISRSNNNQEIILETIGIEELPQQENIITESRLELDEIISILLK